MKPGQRAMDDEKRRRILQRLELYRANSPKMIAKEEQITPEWVRKIGRYFGNVSKISTLFVSNHDAIGRDAS